MPFVYSTQTNSTKYVKWSKIPKEGSAIPRIEQSVMINGGSNMNIKNRSRIAQAVETEVTDEEAEFLKNDPVFQRHMKQGFVTLRARRIGEPDAASKDMEGRDLSAPLHPKDYELAADEQKAVAERTSNKDFRPSKLPQADNKTPPPTPTNFKKKPRFIIPSS